MVNDYLPCATGVISDLAILKTGTNDEIFADNLAKSSAWGFAPWQSFVQGDYSFREMLLRLKINKTAEIHNIHVLEHVLTCDMADLVESGEADVAAIDTEVCFKKIFHGSPQVHVTAFVTPEFCVPQVREVSRKGFIVRLVKQDGELTGGRISFSARGY
ncbi:MAG: hypothetical protein LBV04_02900 [Deferribacteraceae bacterium]|jgi:hypothetical protein|nr:hypothetical protein [Deferribacteraceae bacterium]